MKKEYWTILIVYIAMQFSSLIGIPVLTKLFHLQPKLAVPIWLIISFISALIIVLFILRKEIKSWDMNERGSSIGYSAMWAVSGFFLALFAQYFAAIIEHFLGIPSGSENTKEIIDIINTLPLAVIVTSIAGPILEEIVFRKIIFGTLYKRFNFVISALISSVIFALAHMDQMHILIYAAMGFTFAFLYVRTKRIIVPIFAHVSMNTLVVMVQSVYRNDIERLLRDAEKVSGFIGGFFS